MLSFEEEVKFKLKNPELHDAMTYKTNFLQESVGFFETDIKDSHIDLRGAEFDGKHYLYIHKFKNTLFFSGLEQYSNDPDCTKQNFHTFPSEEDMVDYLKQVDVLLTNDKLDISELQSFIKFKYD